jgi:aldose 1-epimerase
LLQYERRWEVTGGGARQVKARLEFWRYPELMAQFPFAHSIEIEYRLNDGALEVETVIRNEGNEPMPVALGFHPYFQVNDAPRDEWKVTLAARERYTLSPRLIPTGEVTPNPHSNPVLLGNVHLDDVFGALVRDPDGFARFSVRGKRESVTVEYGPGFDVAVVYAPKGRDFICFEPMTAITNAFNAAHAGWYKGLPSIAPGGIWKGVFRVVAAGY